MACEIAACGLVCDNCARRRKGKCPGCRQYEKAAWCGVRRCCIEHGWRRCAECTRMPLERCRDFNSFMSKVFALLFRSDRRGCIERIRRVGYEAYGAEMMRSGRMNRPVGKDNNVR